MVFGLVVWRFWQNHLTNAVQFCATAFATVFVGVLIRNNSRNQQLRAEALSRRQAFTQTKTELLQRQPTVISQLGSEHEVLQAAAITQLAWLIRAWDALEFPDSESDNKNSADAERLDHIQELVTLAFCQPLGSKSENSNGPDSIEPEPQKVIEARAQALFTLVGKVNRSGHVEQKGVLTHTDVTEISFAYAVLQGAELAWANLQNAELHGADLQPEELLAGLEIFVDLAGAILLDWYDLDDAEIQRRLQPAKLDGLRRHDPNSGNERMWGDPDA